MKQAVLGTGLVLAPMAWFASLEANFALAPSAPAPDMGKAFFLLVSATAFRLGRGQRPVGLDTTQFSTAAWLSPAP